MKAPLHMRGFFINLEFIAKKAAHFVSSLLFEGGYFCLESISFAIFISRMNSER